MRGLNSPLPGNVEADEDEFMYRDKARQTPNIHMSPDMQEENDVQGCNSLDDFQSQHISAQEAYLAELPESEVSQAVHISR